MAKAKYDGRKNLIPVHDHETAVMLGHMVGKTKLTPLHSDWCKMVWDSQGGKAELVDGGE